MSAHALDDYVDEPRGKTPTLFGALIASGSRTNVFYGYVLGAILMALGGVVALLLGVNAERRALEDIATPLTAVRAKEAPTAA